MGTGETAERAEMLLSCVERYVLGLMASIRAIGVKVEGQRLIEEFFGYIEAS